MRRTVAGPVKANVGQRVRFQAWLPKDQTAAFLSVYCACGDVEPSPYIPISRGMLKHEGRPTFSSPTIIRLSTVRPYGEVEFLAEEKGKFYLIQEVDFAKDPSVKTRTNRHVANRLSQALSSLGRFLRGR